MRGPSRRSVVRSTLAICAVAWTAAPRTAADDPAAPPYFCERFVSGTWIDRIAAGPDGSVCIAGRTVGGGGLPGEGAVPEGDYLGFVTVFEPDGRVRWSQYLHSGPGWINDVAVAADGSIWVAATLESYGPFRDDLQVTKLGSGGEILFMEDIRGSGDDVATHLAIAANGDAVVVGTTRSPDFPTVAASQPQIDGPADGFVLRLHGDGSGIAWSTFLGGPGFDDANAVAIEPSGDLLVTTRVLSGTPYWTGQAQSVFPIESAALVRMSGDGVPKSVKPLALGKIGGALDVVVGADGRILVGGAFGFVDWDSVDGFIVAVDPADLSLGARWILRDRPIFRVTVSPDGSVLAGTDRDWHDDWANPPRDGGFVHLSPDLGRVLRRVDREEGWGVRDVAFAPDGALCMGGRGGKAAAVFRESLGGGSIFFGEPFVARLPSRGAAPPSHVRVAQLSPTAVDLEWPQDGDRVERFEVEQRVPTGNPYSAWTYRLLRRLPSSASASRVTGLTSGATLQLRLVAVFASGVRSTIGVPTLRTPPAPIRRVAARFVPGRGYVVDIRGPARGDRTTYELERSVDGGPYARVPDFQWRAQPLDCDPECRGGMRFFDNSRSIRGARVVYRARAVTVDPRVETPWRYSFAVWPR